MAQLNQSKSSKFHSNIKKNREKSKIDAIDERFVGDKRIIVMQRDNETRTCVLDKNEERLFNRNEQNDLELLWKKSLTQTPSGEPKPQENYSHLSKSELISKIESKDREKGHFHPNGQYRYGTKFYYGKLEKYNKTKLRSILNEVER
jgi:hypothetical protein